MTDSKLDLAPNYTFRTLLASVVLLTVASGAMYGRLTQRWGQSADLVAAGDHVRGFPSELGKWRLHQESTMPDRVQQTLECSGYVNRTYIHSDTGQEIGMAIHVGPPGPTAVHTPEICYSSRSHVVKERPKKKEAENETDSFWGMLFQSRHVGAGQLRVYYAWNNGDAWQAADNPRILFGGDRLLFKAQVSGPTGLAFGTQLEDPAWDFCQTLCNSSWSPVATVSIPQ